MTIEFGDIMSVVTLLLGGGGLGGLLTWKYARKKEQAEAASAETMATKEVQDVYQQLIEDVKKDRDEQKQYIAELKEDRQHLRAERDELRERIDKTDETVRDLQMQVAKNGRKVEMMTPFMCSDLKCKKRLRGIPQFEENAK